MHPCMYVHMQTFIHAHAWTYAHMHACTCTHTQTHMLPSSNSVFYIVPLVFDAVCSSLLMWLVFYLVYLHCVLLGWGEKSVLLWEIIVTYHFFFFPPFSLLMFMMIPTSFVSLYGMCVCVCFRLYLLVYSPWISFLVLLYCRSLFSFLFFSTACQALVFAVLSFVLTKCFIISITSSNILQLI